MDKTYVLDTSVILHNWNVLNEKWTKIIPQCALDEMEKFQNEPGDLGDNARNAAWWLSKRLNSTEGPDTEVDGNRVVFWQDNDERTHDGKIIRTADEVRQSKAFFDDELVILTKSVALRAKARNYSIQAEDYNDVGLVAEIDGWDYVDITPEEMEMILADREGNDFRLEGRESIPVNQYIVCRVEGSVCQNMLYRHIGGGMFRRLDFKPHMASIVPKNMGQIMFANSLMDKDIPLVSAIGAAGSGKTIMAIAAAIQQVLIKPKLYDKIIITRPIMPVGRDIGFLPGDVNEKMAEWVRPFMNNIEYIKKQNEQKGKGKVSMEKITPLLDLNLCKDIMEVLPLTYIRGSSISNAFIIVDEAQNATPSEMKTIITRVGENSKLVLTGDINQIDNKFLSRECNGLTMAIKKFWGHSLYSHVTLRNVERSPLAELATKVLF